MQLSSFQALVKHFVTDAQVKVTRRVERSKRKSLCFVERVKQEKVPDPMWTAGVPIVFFGHCIFYTLFLTSRVKIVNKHLLPYWTAPLLVLSNHPSFWEAYLLPYIFGWRSLWLRFFPWSTPDANNFGGKLWSLCRTRFKLVPRKTPRELAQAVKEMVKLVLDYCAIIIMFVEGRRTGSGTNLAFCHDEKCRMLEVGGGAARVIDETKVPALLVFVEGSDDVCPHHRRYPTWSDLTTKSTTFTIGIVIKYEDYDFTGCKNKPQRIKRISETQQRKFEELALECKDRRDVRAKCKTN